MSEDGQAARPPVPTDPPPRDIALLKILACGQPASTAGEQLGMTMAEVATRLQRLRAYYDVDSTIAVLRQAAAHGHLQPHTDLASR